MTNKLHLHDNTLSYGRVGQGPVVLFLHGFLGDSSVWNYTIKRLLVNFDCVSVDLPDHGSSKLHAPNFTFDSLADSICSLLEIEDINDFHIIGHSMGGYAGLSLSKLISTRVKSITLINSTALPDTSAKKVERDRAIRVFDLSPKVYIKAAIRNLIYVENHDRLELEIDNLVGIASNLSIKGAKAALNAMKVREDYVPFLSESQMPIHMISGLFDTICPLGLATSQLINLNAQHTVLQNSAHMAFVEEPDELLRQIEKYLINF